MKLLEYEAKHILSRAGIPVPSSSLIKPGQVPTIPLPFVLKSQVTTGGRGKAGGIVVVESDDNTRSAAEGLFRLSIKDLLPLSLLAEEKLSIDRELYISILVDRTSAGVELIAHTNGGVEVEDNTDFKTWRLDYDNPGSEDVGQQLADYYGLAGQTFALQDLVENLHTCLKKNDATLIEINPLVLTTDGLLVAGDCKMTLDDAAAFRHDWAFVDQPAQSNFVTIDSTGNIATVANGAGLAMATVDAVFNAELKPANFLDIGGGANTETLLAAFRKIIEYTDVQAIVINIFAGITRADEVANAIVAAKQHITNLPPLFIRLAGTNYQQAENILSHNDIALLPDLESCLAAAKKVIHE